mgnify:CR=1 FL=1
MDNYVYLLGNKIYLNLTNRCSNGCTFCIRNGRQGMNGSPLWIKNEPSAEDVIAQLPPNLSDYDNEVVFCGFGEPTYNLSALEETAEFLHCADKKTRVNTNGHTNLIHGRDVTDVVVDSCDVINVSLNQCSAKKYDEVCRSVYGEKAFDALLEFASLCKAKGGNVVFSVVDVIGGEDVQKCRRIAEDMGIPLRVRVKE